MKVININLCTNIYQLIRIIERESLWYLVCVINMQLQGLILN